jgi:hypothetical protein
LYSEGQETGAIAPAPENAHKKFVGRGRSDFKYSRQAAILENQQSAITPELMAGSYPNFYHWDI